MLGDRNLLAKDAAKKEDYSVCKGSNTNGPSIGG